MDASIPQNAVTYKHDTLPDAAGYMRLLQVLDDNYSEDIKVRCEMTTWPLDDMPSYHAISYTWGDPASNTTILVNGKAFRVRTNCEFVLKQAYGFEKTLCYWVDAICINQENLEEKSIQVSIMGSIFKKAAHVLSCVGDHADDSAFLFQKLRQRVFRKPPNRSIADMRLSLRFQLRQRTSTTMRFLDAAVCFLERPYFTRLWVLQELRNAQEATFLCGSDAVPKPVIYDIARGIYCHFVFRGRWIIPPWVPTNIAKKFPVIRRLWAAWEYRQNYSSAFHQKHQNLEEISDRARSIMSDLDDVWSLIQTASKLQCQEANDKLFGLISLIDWGPSTTIIPDYTQTEFEAAVSFFKAILSSTTYQRESTLVDITMTCIDVVDTLGLNIKSHRVPSALESRRTESGTILAGDETAVEFTHSRYDIWPGWRLCSEHLGKTDLGLSTWSPPGSVEPHLYLPFWAKGGDWVVWAGGYSPPGEYVVVREAAEGFGGSLIGHAVHASKIFEFQYQNEAHANFKIHWDPEDLVIYSLMENEIIKQGDVENSSQWATLLNTAVCKKQTPSSSYALRCDAVSCELYLPGGVGGSDKMAKPLGLYAKKMFT